MIMRNAWGRNGDDDPALVGGVMTVKVKNPGGIRPAQEIRNIILREYFGYTDIEIQEFNRKYPNDYII